MATTVGQQRRLSMNLSCIFVHGIDLPSPCLTQNSKKCYSSHHIEYLRSVHRVLNVDEKKLIAQFGGKLRDERFEPN